MPARGLEARPAQHLWVIDYNRQSLDGVVHEGLYERIEAVFRAFKLERRRDQVRRIAACRLCRAGWRPAQGLDRRLPERPLSALMFRGGAAWRERLEDEIGDQGPVSALLQTPPDAELAGLMANLGGHCTQTLLEQFEAAKGDQPTAFIAYTVKGWGTPLAGHKDNHAGQMTAAQIEQLRTAMQVRPGHEWDKLRGWRRAPPSSMPSSPRCRSTPATPGVSRRRRCPASARCNWVRSRFRRRPPSARSSTPSPGPTARWRRASSPPRRTSRSRPTSAAGSTAGICSPGASGPTCSRPSASRARRNGSSRPRASISSSASPK